MVGLEIVGSASPCLVAACAGVGHDGRGGLRLPVRSGPLNLPRSCSTVASTVP